ncbi:MAG: hypothetical protein HYX92_16675 [Chloroflexi bacterium]|nr:hypothetical protein [Chloroflexota bacterium]
MKFSRLLVLSVSLLAIIGLVVAGCAPAAPAPARAAPTPAPKALAAAPTQAAAPAAKPAAPAPSPKPAEEQPRYGGVLTIGSESDPSGLDPHQDLMGSTINIIAPVYNGVVRADPMDTTKVIPDLAESWNVSADGTTYTFRLLKGVKFHDGTPFSSPDAKYSLERIKNPTPPMTRSPRKDFLQAIARVEAPDDQTLKIVTSYPSASFLPMLASPWMLMVPRHVVEKEGDLTKLAVGTGPFKFKSLTRGVSGRVAKNPDYFVKGRPYLDEIIVYVVPDSFTRFAALRAGNILLIRGTPGISATQVKTIEATMADKIVLQKGPQGLSQGMGLNSQRAPFTDIRVRQAINYALDRETAIKVNEGAGVIGGMIPPFWGWGLPPEELTKLPGFGPDKEANLATAKKLLAEAGFPDGFKTTITTRKHPGHEPVAVFANAELAKIGIQVQVQLLETAMHTDRRVKGDFDILSLNLAASMPDPDETLSSYWLPTSGMNGTRYENPKFTELFEKETRTLDTAERRKMIHEMQKIAITDSVNITWLWYIRTVPHWVQVKGFKKAPHHYYATRMEQVWLAK